MSQFHAVGRTSFSQSSSHSVLGGEDVTGRPATLSPQHNESFNQHLQQRAKHLHLQTDHSTARDKDSGRGLLKPVRADQSEQTVFCVCVC